jgi:serine phosphatase RsbU (regulator of sigma subunit)
MNAHLLARVPIFRGLPQSELDFLAEHLETREVAPGTVIFEEGQTGEHFYVVIYGQVDVIKSKGTAEERLVASRGAGDFVGELGLVNPDGLRTATVQSRGPASIWVMSRAEFHDLLGRHPGAAAEIVRVLSARLTHAHDKIIRDLHAKNEQLQAAYDELKAAQSELVEKEKLERELEVAFEIQMSILPQELPDLSGYNFGAKISPARAVGGDFFDVFALDENRVGVVIGDVADKGVPSAIFMAQTHALIYAEARRDSRPGTVLAEVNRHLLRMNATGLFVTVIYGIVDCQEHCFTYARAGHELPFYSAEESVKMTEFEQGQPLGLLEDPVFDVQSLDMPPGRLLFLYTDGLSDCRSPKGEFFGLERVEARLAQSGMDSPQEICDRVWQDLQDHQQGIPQDDDVTLVALRAHPAV